MPAYLPSLKTQTYRRPSLTKHSYARSIGDLISRATGACTLLAWTKNNFYFVSSRNTYRIDELREIRGIGLAVNVVVVDAGDLIHQAEV